MQDKKIKEIREFCERNFNQSNIDKYSRYFREGFNGYGIDREIYEAQRDRWISEWKDEMSLHKYLELGKKLVAGGKYEEISFAIGFIRSERENFTESTFVALGEWFEYGITNWANTDVLCMAVLSSFLTDGVIGYEKLKEWTGAKSQWQRRCVPVTLVELVKNDLKPDQAFSLIEPIMTDNSEYVQKGIGTLLRELWKKYPDEVEDFMMNWKDECGRLIIQYATEKMDKEYRKKFRKKK